MPVASGSSPGHSVHRWFGFESVAHCSCLVSLAPTVVMLWWWVCQRVGLVEDKIMGTD